ncbi:MAG: tetratricopeptide repeat protein [Elusimicrobiota bacterium]
MTKKWVKDELKKNPINAFIIKVVDYVKKNKNNVTIGIVIVIIMGLFIGMMARRRILANKEASELFAAAQNLYDRYKYEETIDKLNEIYKNYRNTKIIDQVLYYKGLSFHKQGELEKSKQILEQASKNYKNSEILSEIKITLGSVYEDLGEYEKAVQKYKTVSEDGYLKPEALMGMARIYEIEKSTAKAVEVYKRVQSHYVGSWWEEMAKKRLSELGVEIESDKELTPKLNIE